MTSNKRRYIRTFLLSFWTLVFIWLFWNLQAHGVDPEMFISSESVTVSIRSDRLIFEPVNTNNKTGLIYYPGALVDTEAYIPFCRIIAENGYKVVLFKLPFRLAPLQSHKDHLFAKTLQVIKNDDNYDRWIVGGHSKGAKLSTHFASVHPTTISGMLLIGSSHPREEDLSSLNIDVTKISGSEDGLASPQEIEEFSVNLPPTTHYTSISGGNHQQFAWYGYQLGDGSANISRVEQQEQTINAVLAQFERVENSEN